MKESGREYMKYAGFQSLYIMQEIQIHALGKKLTTVEPLSSFLTNNVPKLEALVYVFSLKIYLGFLI